MFFKDEENVLHMLSNTLTFLLVKFHKKNEITIAMNEFENLKNSKLLIEYHESINSLTFKVVEAEHVG